MTLVLGAALAGPVSRRACDVSTTRTLDQAKIGVKKAANVHARAQYTQCTSDQRFNTLAADAEPRKDWGGSVFLAYALIPERWMLYPLLLIGGLHGVATPSINALMSRELGPERQGELQGGMASVMGLSSIVGPFALTQTLALFSSDAAIARDMFFPGAAFALAAVLAGLCFLILLSRLRANAARAAAVPAQSTEADAGARS